jgi:hypothetical protein
MRMRWSGSTHRKIENAYKKLKGRAHLGDLDVDERRILKWSSRNEIRGCVCCSSV